MATNPQIAATANKANVFGRSEFAVEPPAPIERRLMATGTGDVLSVCLMLLHRHTNIAMIGKLRLANRVVAEFIEGKRPLIPEL